MFGRRAAHTTKETYKPGEKQADLPANAGEETISKLDQIRFSKGTEPTAKIRLQMQKTMQRHAAVFRK